MKTHFSAILLVIFNVNLLFSQKKELDVPLVAQRTTHWCWAACMESVTKFNNRATFSQCDFVKSMIEIRPLSNAQKTKAFNCQATICNNSDTCRSFQNPDNACNWDMPIKKNGISNFELTLLNRGFSSKEETGKMSWEVIKSQINDSMPFIIAVQLWEDPPGVQGGHALVVSGYRQTASNNFMICNNPWMYSAKTANGTFCKFYKRKVEINYNVFSRSVGVYKSVSAYVKDIKKLPLPVAQKATETNQNEAIIEDSTTNENGIRTNLDDKSLKILLKNENFYVVPTVNISTKNLPKNGKGNVDLSSTDLEKNVIEVMDKQSNPPVKTVMQKIDNTWTPVEIYEADVRDSLKIKVNNEFVTLFNGLKKDERAKATPYKVINLRQFQFYSFNFKEKIYVTPQETYDEIRLLSGNLIKKGEAYRNDKIAQSLTSFLRKNL